MPLVYQQDINADTKLGVWHIAEPEDFFLQKVMLQKEITHPHKRLQHLAGRFILKELFPDFPLELIEIADTKKPFLADEMYHFSISHCADYAAAMVSKVNRVGVDIEIPHQKIERIIHKFLNDKEVHILKTLEGNLHQSFTIAWSIKEALFKWYGDGGIDFKKHLHIEKICKPRDVITANCLISKKTDIPLKANGIVFQGNSLVWICS